MTFLEKQTDPTKPMHWRGNMQADYFYSNGVAGDRFFKHLMKNDSFLSSECPKCGKNYLPPRLYCEDCFVEIPDDAWAEAPLEGIVRLYTVARVDAHGEPLEDPVMLALIDINGTDGSLLARIKMDETLPMDLSGLLVKAVLKPKKSREGTIKDILYFEPV